MVSCLLSSFNFPPTDAGYQNTWPYQPTTFNYIFTLGLGKPVAKIIDTPRAISDHHAISIELPQK